MDPTRHHDFMSSNDNRSRTAYYGRDVPNMTSHSQYYATTNNTRAINNSSSSTRKPSCGCSGSNIMCNVCRSNATDDSWGPTTTIVNEHTQRDDYRVATEPPLAPPTRTTLRQSPMFLQQSHGLQILQTQPSSMVNNDGNSTSGNNRAPYWSHNSTTATTAPFADEHHHRLRAQSQIDITMTRRSTVVDNAFGQTYKPPPPSPIPQSSQASSLPSTHSVPYHHPPPTLLANAPNVQPRVGTIGGTSVANVNSNLYPSVNKERIYEQPKYSSNAKVAYNPSASAATAPLYDNHQHPPQYHHHLHHEQNHLNAALPTGRTLPIDHHVINPSNLPASKDQHPSPNYARKCPQIFSPDDQNTPHHHLYMSTPQFSSDKFTRGSPQQSEYAKLRESPLHIQPTSGNSFIVQQHSDKYSNPPQRESPQYTLQSTSSMTSASAYSRTNPVNYYSVTSQATSKIHPPEMSPVITKQTHLHYPYSKAPLAPPPPHMQQQSTVLGAKTQPSVVLAPPPASAQNTIVEYVKREEIEGYGNHPQTVQSARSIYVNPYNTPPPTTDSYCKDTSSLSNSSSPYTAGSTTPNYRVESPHCYPTKYAKLSTPDTITSSKHSLINQNTPPPSRAPSQRSQQQTGYYYDSNFHSAPSPAVATAASPSPSSLLSTTSQTQLHHNDYMTSQTGPPPPQSAVHQHNVLPSYAQTPQHQTSAALRNHEIIVTPQHHNYERPIHLPVHQPITAKTTVSPANVIGVLPKSQSKQKKPNYRELINRTLAIRNATSEDELNMKIIKKALNVDTLRNSSAVPMNPPSRVPIIPAPGPHLTHSPIDDRVSVLRGESLRHDLSALSSVKPLTSLVMLPHGVPASGIVGIPETSRGIMIKQEDEKPTPSSTSSSPLDLSMRTVKTKADSTEYKYQQQHHQQPNRTAASSSSSHADSHYTLPRVDFTPNFSLHAMEPSTSNGPAPPTSRVNSYDRHNYTPPKHPPPSVAHNYPQSESVVSHHIPPAKSYSSAAARSLPVESNISHNKSILNSESSLVIKTAIKPAVHPDVDVRCAPLPNTQSRPTILETNPYTSVIKTEPKHSDRHTLTAVERLPPDTSIMALPPRTSCTGTTKTLHPQTAQISASSNSSCQPSAYTLACEKNPNFLGRKRHLQEYTQRMEPLQKQGRHLEAQIKTQVPMRPADISVIAVNERNCHDIESPSQITVEKSITAEIITTPRSSTPTVAVSTVIANSGNYKSIDICKQEPLTSTAECTTVMTNKVEIAPSVQQSSSRIRTKAELKGFTFNPPIPSTSSAVTSPPAPEKHEEVKIKIEQDASVALVPNIDLPSIPGLNDHFNESSLLGWNNTCNNFMEQLQTRSPISKKRTLAINNNKKSLDEMDPAASNVNVSLVKKSEDGNYSNIESADNTHSSFLRFEGADSSMTFRSLAFESQNSQTSPTIPKKISKSEREKKRLQQEKRIAERLKAKDTTSESEDELDKRKTERLKKPTLKSKLRERSNRNTSNNNSSNSSSRADKNHFSDCGSDSTSETEAEKLSETSKLDNKPTREPEREERERNSTKIQGKGFKIVNDKIEKGGEESGEGKKSTIITTPTKKDIKKNSITNENVSKEQESSENSSSEEREDKKSSSKQDGDEKTKPKAKFIKGNLNTMTRSKRKKELEMQLANSKVLRNDKIIRNSTTKIKRKYVKKYTNNVVNIADAGGLSREAGIMKSTRLKAKLEKTGNNLSIFKTKEQLNSQKIWNDKELKHKSPNCKSNDQRSNDMLMEVYRFKRALKVPPSLISIKHPGSHKISASLPDLERNADISSNCAKKNKSTERKSGVEKSPLTMIKKTESSAKVEKEEEHLSFIDMLHSRVTKSTAAVVHGNKSNTTTITLAKSSRNISTFRSSNSANNCSMFSETSQTTESSELQMLPALKKDSDEDDDDDNESQSGKKRHFSIFETKVLPTKTRTESKMQQKRENIREIFVGDDRPASAPPEMVQSNETGGERMTYEQKYEQFLQQMNIVINEDKLGRFNRTARKLAPPKQQVPINVKPEEDTESCGLMDADDLNSMGGSSVSKDGVKIDLLQDSSRSHTFRKRRGKYLRRKGSSGFDYIRKKKKPTPTSGINNSNSNQNCSSVASTNLPNSLKYEKIDNDEDELKVKTEDDVSREIQKWVLNKGVGQSTMHKAARQGYIDVIVYCLDRLGMNPDQKDNAGYTPLHEACTNGWLDIARVLLQYGANHSEAAHSGIRPLHEASDNDHEEIVRLLLAYGADPLLATYSGQTPLMLASSTTMRDILRNHLIDVQATTGPERTPWKFLGPWQIFDPKICGYNVFEGAPISICDMNRALLRRSSFNTSQIILNKTYKQQQHQVNNLNSSHLVMTKSEVNVSAATTSNSNNNNLTVENATSGGAGGGGGGGDSGAGGGGGGGGSGGDLTRQHTSTTLSTLNTYLFPCGGGCNSDIHQSGEINSNPIMDKCAVVLDNFDRFNSLRLFNNNKPEILVENSDSEGEMFEFEEADVLLPPLYLLKDEGVTDKWVLLSDLCNLLKVKSKDTLLNKIYPSSSSIAPAKNLMRELKMSDFLEKATCLQLLCAGEKLNICASKVVLIKYNENVRNLLGVNTILMKF
uniref:ANK_REP_REGION domain-containing protein n=1 Tax=Glossina brevipalpis TaxID=37001 RepID=A0A1A9W3H5_9MUSC